MYVHGVLHSLRSIAVRAGIQVCFYAPKKPSALCGMEHRSGKAASVCQIKHENPFVDCMEGVVHDLPLDCGNRYISQTGRCLPECLREHHNNVKNKVDGHLAIHCSALAACKCFKVASSLAKTWKRRLGKSSKQPRQNARGNGVSV